MVKKQQNRLYVKDIKHHAGDTNLNLNDYSVYTVAGVITHFFNESKEPIFPFEIYDLCIECMGMELFYLGKCDISLLISFYDRNDS